eukprot:786204_1
MSREERAFKFIIIQCDEREFLLESFISARITKVRVQSDDVQFCEEHSASYDVPLVQSQHCSRPDRILTASARWPADLCRHWLLREATPHKKTLCLDMEFRLYLAKNTQPILLKYTVRGKMISKSRALLGGEVWSGEDRLHQISAYYKVFVRANAATVAELTRKWERHRQAVGRALRVDRIKQYLRLRDMLAQCGIIQLAPLSFVPHFYLSDTQQKLNVDATKAVIIRVQQVAEIPDERRGYLMKRGKHNRAFKRRWCVLRRPYLYYYLHGSATGNMGSGVGSVSGAPGNNSKSTEKGVVNLIGATLKGPSPEENPFKFSIETQGRLWIFEANSFDDAMAWCKALDPWFESRR